MCGSAIVHKKMIGGEHLCSHRLAKELDKSGNSLQSIFSSFRNLRRREMLPEKEDLPNDLGDRAEKSAFQIRSSYAQFLMRLCFWSVEKSKLACFQYA